MDTSGLPIQFEEQRGCATLTLAPEVNSSPWDVVERSGSQIISQLENGRIFALIVDLTPLNYLGSAQVALLVRVWKALSARNGKMVVQLTSPMVRDVLRTAGLNRYWQFVETRSAAYEFLGFQPDGIARRRPVWLLLGGLGLIAATVVTLLQRYRPDLVGSDAGWIAMAAAALAIIAGLGLVIRTTHLSRGIGVLLLLLGLGVAGYQIERVIHPPQVVQP